jgi:hypothetical protein
MGMGGPYKADLGSHVEPVMFGLQEAPTVLKRLGVLFAIDLLNGAIGVHGLHHASRPNRERPLKICRPRVIGLSGAVSFRDIGAMAILKGQAGLCTCVELVWLPLLRVVVTKRRS